MGGGGGRVVPPQPLAPGTRGPAPAPPETITSETVVPGHNVDLVSLTATVEYKIWRGLVGRLEYRHDEASRRAFGLQNHGRAPTSYAQDTMTAALYYSFF